MELPEHLQSVRRDQEIDGWRVRTYFWSRNIWLLAGIAAVILALAGGAGWFLRGPDSLKNGLSGDGSPLVSLRDELSKEAPDPVRVFEAIAAESFIFENEEGANSPEEWIGASKLATEPKQIAILYLQSVLSADRLPCADLLFFSHWVKPFRFANELVGDLHRETGDFLKARKYYEREEQLHDAASARAKLVSMLSEQRDFASLSPLAKDARYREHFSFHTILLLAVHEHRWQDIVQPLTDYEMSMWEPIPATLAIVAGVVWIAIALQAIQPQAWFCFRSIVPLFAVLAGMMCTWVTLFVGLWEAHIWGLRETGEFLPDFLYYVAGVGPREELMKLAFFLPFVPFLMRRGSRLEMLMVAGCIGLGFAIEKNLQYFEQAGATAAFGRFLTANFFHLAATGLVGLSLCDALKEPRKKTLPFLATLLGVTLAHGFYDALLGVVGLQVLSIYSMIVYLVLALSFFRQLRSLRDDATDHLSIAATLVIGLAVIVAVMFVLASQLLGFQAAGMALTVNGPSLIVVYYMFYWQLGGGVLATKENLQKSFVH